MILRKTLVEKVYDIDEMEYLGSGEVLFHVKMAWFYEHSDEFYHQVGERTFRIDKDKIPEAGSGTSQREFLDKLTSEIETGRKKIFSLFK